MDWLEWLIPWEFSPTLVAAFVVAIVLFVRGQRVHHVTAARQWLFWSGMVLLYLSMHTRLDYYAERMFFIHRAQHLVLHHLGPLLVMAAFPGSAMRAGLPMAWRVRLRDFLRTGTGRALAAVLTHKVFVPTLFVFLVLVWLLPSVQFYSMLDWRLYRLMNWSVVISGFMYWNLILDRRPSPPAAMTPGLAGVFERGSGRIRSQGAAPGDTDRTTWDSQEKRNARPARQTPGGAQTARRAATPPARHHCNLAA